MAEGRVQRDHRRSFGETVALPNSDSGRSEPAGRVDAERRTTRDEDSHAPSESLADFGVDEFVRELPRERVGFAAVINRVGEARALTNSPREHALLDGRLRGLLLDGLAN